MPEDKKRLISLKEAAELSGYSPDYVGQLIRSGKIPGKQVYCSIAWMTTPSAVLDYKAKTKSRASGKGLKSFLVRQKHRIGMEFNTLKLFLDNFRAWPLFVLAVVALLLFNVCILYFLFAPEKQTANAGSASIEAAAEAPMTY